jgi:titin
MFSHRPKRRRESNRQWRRLKTRPEVLELESRWLLSAYIVNDSGDLPLDPPKGPGMTINGTITLRSAIEQVNIDGSGSISFAQAMTISPASPLDTITASGVTIDGGTVGSVVIQGCSESSGLVIQGGGATIENLVIDDFRCKVDGIDLKSANNLIQNNYIGIDASGSSAAGNYNGIHDTTGSNTIRDNVVSGNLAMGILLSGGSADQIYGNLIGTDATGKIALGNTDSDIYINQSDGNTIGGTTASARNIIAASVTSGYAGIDIDGSNGTVVAGNYIGTDVTGSVALGNQAGVAIFGGSQLNTIGGTAAGARNVISGNAGNGVDISGQGTSQNVVAGNWIGTDSTGKVPLGNAHADVDIYSSASSNTIGGTTASARNIIAASVTSGYAGINIDGSNDQVVAGNYIGTDVTGSVALGNQIGVAIFNGSQWNTIGGTTAGARNVISGNTGDGVDIAGQGTSKNLLVGNYLGTDASGKNALGNTDSDIYINQSDDNTIGGTITGARNIIAANLTIGYGGVDIYACNGNVVAGNYIGTDVTGAGALGNQDGVDVFGGSQSNTIGGTAAGARNVISGNVDFGVFLSDPGTKLNLVAGNRIGTNATGSAALGNHASGVLIYGGAQSNTIGGTTAGARNVISGNAADGVDISGQGTSQNLVAGNFVGTDVTGKVALGNSHADVYIYSSASSNTIGGASAAARNVIAANVTSGYAGVDIYGASSNLVDGNYIGTDLSGSKPLGNQLGVLIWHTSTSNTIGGTTAGAGNVIAFSKAGGVVAGSSTTDQCSGNAILGNAIFSNTKLGIDLGDDGVTQNGASGHSGPNLFQDFPVLTSVVTAGGITTITGTLAAAANTTYRLEFFSNPTKDPSGFGQGQSFLTSASVTTDSSGNATFSVQTAGAVPAGQYVSATATDPQGNTSEFSADLVNSTSIVATQLVVTTEPPSSVTAGAGFSLKVSAEDAHGNVSTSFTGSVTIALDNNPGGSTLGGTLTKAAVNGVVTFSGLTLNKVGSGYTLQATSSGLTAAATGSISVVPAAASKLVVTTQPPASVTAGSGFGFAVTAEDKYGNVVTSYTSSVTVALSNNPGHSTLDGTLTVTPVKGVATFSGLTLNKAATGYTLKTTSGSLTTATTAAIKVTPAAATQLVVTTQPPASVTAGAGFTLKVSAEDPFGNVVTSFTGSVTIALDNNPGGSTLSGTLTVTVVKGVATFTNLSLNKPGSGYTLKVSSTGLTGATTDAFNVT